MSHDPRFIARPYGCRSDSDADMAREIAAELTCPDCGEGKAREQKRCSECEHTCTDCGGYAADAQMCTECTEVLHR